MKLNGTKQTIKELTMILMYLTQFSEYDKFVDEEHFYAWKGYNFGVLNELSEEKYINQGDYPSRTKKVFLTANGQKYAKELLAKYGINEQK